MIHRHSFIAFLVAFIVRIKYIETKPRNQSKTLIIYCIIIAFRIIPIIERSNHKTRLYFNQPYLLTDPASRPDPRPPRIPTAQPLSIKHLYNIPNLYIYNIQYHVYEESSTWTLKYRLIIFYNINKSTAGFIAFPFLRACVGVCAKRMCACVRRGPASVGQIKLTLYR